MSPKLTAFAAAALLVSAGCYASTVAPPGNLSHATTQVNVAGETASGGVVWDSDQDGEFGARSATTLTVNGRVVATHEERAAVVANQWNWTFLLLGSAGLVVSQLARRRPRRGMIPYH